MPAAPILRERLGFSNCPGKTVPGPLQPTQLINAMVAVRNSEVMIQLAVEHGANLIMAGADLPLQLPSHVAPSSDVALVPIVFPVCGALAERDTTTHATPAP